MDELELIESVIGLDALYDSMLKCIKGVLWKDSVASFFLTENYMMEHTRPNHLNTLRSHHRNQERLRQWHFETEYFSGA